MVTERNSIVTVCFLCVIAQVLYDDLAEKLTVSRSAIAKWETDKWLPDISVEYLLDDGSKLDLAVVRKSINLAGFLDKTINVRNKKK